MPLFDVTFSDGSPKRLQAANRQNLERTLANVKLIVGVPNTLVLNGQVRIKSSGNCYCLDGINDYCDYCKYNGQVGTFVTINQHNDDGDFYGVVFPNQEGTIFFFRNELIPLSPESEATSCE